MPGPLSSLAICTGTDLESIAAGVKPRNGFRKEGLTEYSVFSAVRLRADSENAMHGLLFPPGQ